MVAAAHPAEGDETSIVHGDYRLDNMVCSATSRASSPCSTGSSPRSAIRWLTSPTTVRRGDSRRATFRGFAGLISPPSGYRPSETYVAAYCRRIGRGPIDPEQLEFYGAFSLFRLAAILHGILGRVAEGTAASARAVAAGQAAPGLAELAWRKAQHIEGRRIPKPPRTRSSP